MTVITGDLILVTDRPATVTEVWIRAGEIRTHDGGLVLEDRDREPVHDGWLEINVLPGPAILTLVSHGRVRKAIPIVVPDAEATSLEDAVNAAKLAQPSLKTWLEEMAASILAGTKGPRGERGPEGKRGSDGATYYTWVKYADTATGMGMSDDPTGKSYMGIATNKLTSTASTNPADYSWSLIKGDPGPTGTLDLIDESAQTTIDTVVIPAIEGARDDALGQVSGAVDAAVAGSRYGQADSLPADTNLDDLWRATDAKAYRLVAGRNYHNLPTGFALTTNATIIVSATGTSGSQTITQNASGQVWYRPMFNTTITPRGWSAWRRIEGDPVALKAAQDEITALKEPINLSFQRRAQLPEGTDLNTVTGRYSNGIQILGSHGNYPNRPTSGWSPNVAGAMVTFSTGLGDTWQRVWQRFGGHVWERQETANGGFTEWVRVRYWDGVTPEIPDATPGGPQTTWEQTGIITSLDEGQAYQRWLADRQPLVELEEIGQSFQGRPIHSLTIGDRTKPALFIMCAQHGDEIAGRESALIWARMISELRPSFLDHICVVIVPAVNVDKLNIRRLTATGTDLNGGWAGRATKEVQAVWSAIQSYDTRAVIDAHEGGNWTDCQLLGALAPEIAPDVRAASDALVQAVWDGLEANDQPVSLFPGSENLTNSRNRIPYELGIPCLLVETPSNLAGDWNGPGVHPRLYAPALKTRVAMYRTVFESAAAHVASVVSPGYVYSPPYYQLVEGA